MSAFKKLTTSDVVLVPYLAKKDWSFPSSSIATSYQIYTGQNFATSFNPNTDTTTSLGEYKRLIYQGINHMFYQQYTITTLSTQSLASSLYYESASGFRPTGSYFIYNENPGLIRNFPTGTNNTIQVLSISKDVYGSQISPNTFEITSSLYRLKDDGRGNIYIAGIHVGNIFYSHGLVIVTNQQFQDIFDPNAPIQLGDFSLDYNDDFFV